MDIDEGDNAKLTYSIIHVSNNGGNKFTIDPNTGVICKYTAHVFMVFLCDFMIFLKIIISFYFN